MPSIELPSPEDEEDLLNRIGGNVLGGIGWVGGSLSKAFGGRAIRGALGGRIRELASVIPFSDTLGITDPSQEVSGAELLGNRDASFLSPEGLGGFALEIATDPGTYLTLGGAALSKLGKAAKMAGVAPKTGAARAAGVTGAEAAALAKQTGQTVADVAGKSLGGNIGLSLPFGQHIFGDIPFLGQQVTGNIPVGKIAQAIEPYIPFAKATREALAPYGRGLRALFDPEVLDLASAKGQEIGPGFYAARRAGREAELEGFADILRAGKDELATNPQAMRKRMETGLPSGSADIDEAGRLAVAQNSRIIDERIAWGDRIDVRPGFAHRQVQNPEWDVGTDWMRTRTRGRVDFLDAETQVIEDMVRDPFIGTTARQAASNADAAQYILRKYGPQYGSGFTLQDAEKVAETLYSLDPRRQKIGFFGNAAITDQYHYAASSGERLGTLKEGAKRIAMEAGAPTPGSKRVSEFLSDVGLTDKANGKIQGLLAQMGKSGNLDDLYLPREVTNALSAIINNEPQKAQAFTELVKGLLAPFDSLQNLFRGHVTLPFPAFHLRNWASSRGWLQSVLTGSPQAALRGNLTANKAFRGEIIEGASKWKAFEGMGLTDEQATKKAANWLFASGLTDRGQVTDVLGHSGAQSLLEALPGMTPDRPVGLAAIPQYAKNMLVPESWGALNPFASRGVGGAPESKFWLSQAGEKFASIIEQTSRAGGALELLRQGFSFDMASAMTKAAHVDYTKLSTFEREVMRRLIPFYSWSRGNIPFQIKQVMENPGGMTGTAVKASAAAQGGSPGFIPEWLGEGTVAPLGAPDAEGRQQYLTQLGLPYEDLGGLTSLRRLAGQLSPLVKYPLEQITGRQLLSGRELRDLAPLGTTVGGMAPDLLENALANSPAARYLSTIRRATDDRGTAAENAVNLLTGLRFSEVNQPVQQRIATRRYIEDAVAGNPLFREYQSIYVPREQIPQLTPEELRLLRLYQATRQRNAAPPQ